MQRGPHAHFLVWYWRILWTYFFDSLIRLGVFCTLLIQLKRFICQTRRSGDLFRRGQHLCLQSIQPLTSVNLVLSLLVNRVDSKGQISCLPSNEEMEVAFALGPAGLLAHHAWGALELGKANGNRLFYCVHHSRDFILLAILDWLLPATPYESESGIPNSYVDCYFSSLNELCVLDD